MVRVDALIAHLGRIIGGMPQAQKIRHNLFIASVVFFVFSQIMLLFKLAVPIFDSQWYLDLDNRKHDVTDFFQYYQASQFALSDLSRHVYDPEVQREWFNKLIAPLHSEKIFYNQQPPYFYPLLIPLRFLPANLAYPTWCLLQTALGLTAVWLVSREGLLNERQRKIFLLGVLASFPAYICLWHGNTSFWLLGFLGLYIHFLYQKKDFAAGVMLAMSTIKPQYAFVMSMPILGMWRWKALVAAIVTEVILLALAVVVIGWENVIGYPQVVTNAESNPAFIGVKPQVMASIRGIFAQFLTIKGSLQATTAIMFVSLIPLLVVWIKTARANSSVRVRWAWALTIMLAIFVSPHTHIFDCVLIALAAVLTMPTLSLIELKELPMWQRIWCALVILFPPLSWLSNYVFGYELSPIVYFVPTVVALFALSVVGYFQSGNDQKVSFQRLDDEDSPSEGV